MAKLHFFGRHGSTTTTTTTLCCLGLWLLILSLQQPPTECRYLPTRSHGDDLDKLRELMLQILESSSEDQQRSVNDATTTNTNNNNALQHRGGAWLNKLNGAGDYLETQRKYAAGAHGIYDNGRYY